MPCHNIAYNTNAFTYLHLISSALAVAAAITIRSGFRFPGLAA